MIMAEIRFEKQKKNTKSEKSANNIMPFLVSKQINT